MKTMNRKSGFTLIEMLIVIAVIGILASIVLVGLGPIQKQARDSRRVSDLRQIQTALEIANSKNSTYPISAANPTTDMATWNAFATLLKGASGVNNIPNDPTTNKYYRYGVTTGGTSYTLGAVMEDASSSVLTNDVDDNPSNGLNCVDGAVTANTPLYCVTF